MLSVVIVEKSGETRS